MDPDSRLTLYTYFRSSAAWRVRIALHLKGLEADQRFVHLLKNEQQTQDYERLNPQHLVPTLVEGGHSFTQSLAIIEYLDETRPTPPLLPCNAEARARVRALAQMIACDIHPLNNLRVLRYLKETLHATEDVRTAWQSHWMTLGFTALENLLANAAETGRYCHGDAPGLADICLIPQLANARRIALDLAPYPTLQRIEQTALAHPAFIASHPDNQPDAI